MMSKFTVENLNKKNPFIEIKNVRGDNFLIPSGLLHAFCEHARKNPQTGKLFFPLGEDIQLKIPEGKKKDMKISFLGYFKNKKVALLLCGENTAYLLYPPPDMHVP